MFDTLIGKYFAKYYIEYLKNKYNENNIYKLIAKIVNRKSILNLPFIKLFNQKSDKFFIENVKSKMRHIIYLLAITHGYIWFNKSISCCYSYGGSTVLEDYINEIRKSNDIYKYEFDYKILKLKKLYNPNIFIKVNNICYLLPDVITYKKNIVSHVDNIKLIKI
jgi:hypothetical protein